MDSISYRSEAPYVNRCSLTCVQPWIPSWFSPTSLDPCLLRHHILGSVLIRLPRSCLHSSPSCSSSSRTPCPHPRAPFRKQLQVLKQASLTSSPISLSSLSPHLLSIQLCWLCGVLSHPFCLYLLVSLSQSQGAVPPNTEGRWKTGPDIPTYSSRGRPCPLSSPRPQWVQRVPLPPL